MSEAGSTLKLSMEYATLSNQNQKHCARQYVPGECMGKWSDEEHMKYIAFIDFNREIMKSKEKRSSNKFYREMAEFIHTRNALQCRSHHQKLQVKYTHPLKIVSFFKHQFDPVTYKDIKETLLKQKQAKKIEGFGSKIEKEISPKNMEIQTQVGQNKQQTKESRTSGESPYYPFASTFSYYGNYPLFCNQILPFSPPIGLYMSPTFSWSHPMLPIGFEFS